MFKINRKVEYALMALKFLRDHSPELISVREISDALSIPFDPTSQVLQTLAKGGLIRSSQGKNGGYQVSFELEQLSFLELSELVEKRKFYHNCEDRDCSYLNDCSIKGPVEKLHAELSHIFKNLKVSKIISEEVSVER